MAKHISLCLALLLFLIAPFGCKRAEVAPPAEREAPAENATEASQPGQVWQPQEPREPQQPPAPPGPAAAAPIKRIKVLYVEGVPRYEYRAIKRMLLHQKKDVIAWCLLLSADKGAEQEHTAGSYLDDNGEERGIQPLTSFPTAEELGKFDVIIWGDVDPGVNTFGLSGDAIKSVSQYVKNGGALICILGENYFPRLYAKGGKGEALGGILPFKITAPPDDFYRERTASFNFMLTEVGADTPTFMLVDDVAKNQKLWKGGPDADTLPGVFWFWPIETDPARDGATVYVRHAADKPQGDGGNSPNYALFFEKKVDKGIVFVSAIDETWRWRFSTGDEPYFAPFWLKVLKHVAAK